MRCMRKYEKSNPEKPTLTPAQKSVGKKSVIRIESIKDAGINYRKEEGIRLPKSFFVIVSGGEKRERDYFKVISNQDKFGRIKIEFVADTKQLYPDGLFNTAKRKKERYESSQENVPDKIFIVSDVDHYYDDLIRIKPKCKKANIQLIISNSCFEIWLYYGKFSNKPTNFVIPADPLKISKSFKAYLDRNVKGGVNPKYAIFDIFAAIKNAKDNYDEDKKKIPTLFSTNMFLLAEELLPLIEDELKTVMDEIEQKNRSYQKRRC